jgi:hypothetical protein
MAQAETFGDLMREVTRDTLVRKKLDERLKALIQKDEQAAEEYAALLRDPDDPRTPQQIMDELIMEVVREMGSRARSKRQFEQDMRPVPASRCNVQVKIAGF